MNVRRHHGQARDRQHQPRGPTDRQAVPGLQHLPGPLSQPQSAALSAHLLREVSRQIINALSIDRSIHEVVCKEKLRLHYSFPFDISNIYSKHSCHLQVFP